jgi:hypothetical protein
MSKYAASTPDGVEGKSRVAITFHAVAPATPDTLLSLVKNTNGVAAAGATSIGVTAGKRLRITDIVFGVQAAAAAAAFATLNLRSNPAGATVLASPSLLRVDTGLTAATIGDARFITVPLPDGGLEFSGAETLGASLIAQAVTNIISISMLGYEY